MQSFRAVRTTITRPASYLRSTSLTPFASISSRRWASQVNSPFHDDAHEVPLFDKLQAHPQAVEAIESLARLMKEKTGVNLSSGEKPTLSLMYKLASDQELRQAAEKLMHELRTAGIAIDPHAAFQALKTMGGDEFNGLSLDEFAGGVQLHVKDEDPKKGGKGESDQ